MLALQVLIFTGNNYFPMKFVRPLLIAFCSIGALSAIAGGLGLIVTKGLGMSTDLLVNTWFNSYLITGLILLVVVGGSYAAAALTTVRRYPQAAYFTATAGFGQIIWVYVELYALTERNVLQSIFFGMALAILILTMLTLRFPASSAQNSLHS